MEILKRHVTLVVALVFAMFSTLTTYHFLKGREREGIVHAKTEQTIPVVVAKHDLAMGIKLSAEDLTVQNWPREIVTEQYFQHQKQLVGRTLRAPVVEEEPITSSKLLNEGENLSTLIPPDMRAVTVSIPRSTTLARVLERGSVVDVLAIFPSENSKMNSKVIAQAVRVLAVDNRQLSINEDKDAKDSKSVEPRTMEVMLLVTPRDADWIVSARSQGTLDLVIRNDRAGRVAHTNPTNE